MTQQPDYLDLGIRTAWAITALVLSGASIRAFIFFGAEVQARKGLSAAVNNAANEFKAFAQEIRNVLGQHEVTLARGDEAREDLERRVGELEQARKRGRRSSDR